MQSRSTRAASSKSSFRSRLSTTTARTGTGAAAAADSARGGLGSGLRWRRWP